MSVGSRASLSRQLLVPIAGLVVVLAGLVVLSGWRQMNRQLDAQLTERARTIVRAIRFSAGAADSRESMIRMTRVLTAGGDAEMVAICGGDPLRAMISTRPTMQGVLLERLPDAGLDAAVCAFLLAGGEGEYLRRNARTGRFTYATRLADLPASRSPLVGAGVLVELPTRALQRQIRDSMLWTMAGVLAIGAAGVAAIGWLLRVRVLHPLTTLAQGLDPERGNVATPAGAAREIALLAESLTRAFAEVSELNRELEQRVRDRTAELVASLDREKEVGRLRTNFIGVVSHEYRNALATVLSSAQMLQRYRDRLEPAEQARHLEQIAGSCRRLASLVEDVLFYSRSESGRIEVNPAPVDLAALSRAAVEEAMRQSGGGLGRVCFAGDESAGTIVSDERLLHHVLSNLLGNAVKYSLADRPVELQVRRESDRVIFKVCDRGIGIPADELPGLGEAFRRGRNVADRPGTGLGLVMVHRCLDLLGGTLNLESVEGEGTTATVTLPLTMATEEGPKS